MENVKNDKQLDGWIKGRNAPDRKKKVVDNVVDIFSRMDGYGIVPKFLMSANFVKRAPKLDDPDECLPQG